MSLRSMTGYGRGQAAAQGLSIVVEISAVNRKQLDVMCSLPRGMNVLEARVTETVQAMVARGRVTIDVGIEWSGAARRRAIRIDEELAAAYVAASRRTARALKMDDAIAMRDVLSFPGVLHMAQPQEDIEQVWRVLHRALRGALRNLDRMRRTEGRALQRDVQGRLRVLQESVGIIKERAPSVAVAYQRRLQKRLREAGIAWREDERLVREVALFADRSDVTEEVTRLESHLAQAQKMTRSSEATGRSLDFLAQELFREINTIGSKANDSSILQVVVAFKAELERIREQVQNIE